MASKKDSLNLQLLLFEELKKLHDYLIDQQFHDSEFVKCITILIKISGKN